MHAADYAISIALNNESELIALNVIDTYRYPILHPQLSWPQHLVLRSMWKRKTAEKWIDTIKDRYKQKTRSDVNTKDLNAEIVGGAKSATATIVEYAESEYIQTGQMPFLIQHLMIQIDQMENKIKQLQS